MLREKQAHPTSKTCGKAGTKLSLRRRSKLVFPVTVKIV